MMKIYMFQLAVLCFAALLCVGYCNHLCVTGSTSSSGRCYTFTVDNNVHASHITTQSAYLYTPGTHSSCLRLSRSPDSTNNWFVLLDEYEICPLNKISLARNAGYQLLFIYSQDSNYRTLTADVIATGYPVVVITPQCASELIERGVFTSSQPPTVSVQQRSTFSGDLVYVTICQATTTSNNNNNNNNNNNDDNNNNNNDDAGGGGNTASTVASAVGGFFGIMFLVCMIICCIAIAAAAD